MTSLGVTAFLSVGHTFEERQYGTILSDAVEFALNCQQSNGLMSQLKTRPTTRQNNGSHTAYYNHGITGVMFGEAYGTTNTEQSERIRREIPQAISVLQKSQFDKRNKGDHGGWQYYTHHIDVDSDMSVTTWQLMFLRSAKNAGFDVPEGMVQAGLEYVARSYDTDRGCFTYGLRGQKQYDTVGSVAGGIISLSMGGQHQSDMAQRAGKWLLRQPWERFNSHISLGGNYYYGLHYCSQASYLLGGKYWVEIYPRIAKVLLENQRPDGSWPPEAGIAAGYGSTYSTALAVLSLTPPYQLLPIYQR